MMQGAFSPRFGSCHIDSARDSVNISIMDMDDDLPRRANDPLKAVMLQDLGPLSVAELHARIASLEAEIKRVRKKLDESVNHKASAEALFRK